MLIFSTTYGIRFSSSCSTILWQSAGRRGAGQWEAMRGWVAVVMSWTGVVVRAAACRMDTAHSTCTRQGKGARRQAGEMEAKWLLTGAPGGVVSVQLDNRLAGLAKGALEGKGAGGALYQQQWQRD